MTEPDLGVSRVPGARLCCATPWRPGSMATPPLSLPFGRLHHWAPALASLGSCSLPAQGGGPETLHE